MTTECKHERCIALFEKMSEYVDNELDDPTCRDIESHVSECLACKICIETLKRTIDLCKNVEKEPVPPEFSYRLRTAVDHFAAENPMFVKPEE